MENGEGRGAKEKEREIVITDEDLFFSFFFPYNISRASKNTWTHAEERSTMKISYVEINSSHRRLQFRRSKRKYYRVKMTRVDKT